MYQGSVYLNLKTTLDLNVSDFDLFKKNLSLKNILESLHKEFLLVLVCFRIIIWLFWTFQVTGESGEASANEAVLGEKNVEKDCEG